MIVYLLKTILIQAIGLVIYYAFLRNQKLFAYARTFLWTVVISSFVAPFIQLQLFEQNEIVSQINQIPQVIELSAITITDAVPQSINWLMIAATITASISLLQLVRLFFSYRKILALKKNAEHTQPNIYASQQILLPFSFVNSIYMPASFLDKVELPFILAHEQAHIDKKHSWDKIVITFLARICWFNPMFILFHKELELVHEYQVDDTVTQKHSREEYLQSLLQSSIYLQSSPIVLTHSFFSSPIKNRIIMLHKKAKNKNLKRISTIAIMLSVIFTVVFFQSHKVIAQVQSTEENKKKNDEVSFTKNDDGTYTKTTINKFGKEIKTIVLKEEVIKLLNRNADANSSWDIGDDGVLQVNHVIDNRTSKQEIPPPEPPSPPSPPAAPKDNDTIKKHITLDFGGRGSVSQIDTKTGLSQFRLLDKGTSTREDQIEKEPSFPGGMEALMKYMSDNLKYPKDAKDVGMSAHLYVEFKINTNGSISDATILQADIDVNKKTDANKKMLEEKLRQEAIRVIKEMPNWEPAYKKNGEVVSAKMVLPIVFKL